MRKILVGLMGLLVLVSAVMAETSNWIGTGDTSKIVVSTTSTATSKAFKLSPYNAVRVDLCLNDTSVAGFASDSINVQLFYQTFHLGLNSSGAIDTVYSSPVVVDTMKTANLGTLTKATMSGVGVPVRVNALVDTLHTSGYATISRFIAPSIDQFIRFYVLGITGNKVGSSVVGYVCLQKQERLPTLTGWPN